MLEIETIDSRMLDLWESDQFFLYTSHFKRKTLKFFLKNPNGVYRVKVKDTVVYEGRDRDKAIKEYNKL